MPVRAELVRLIHSQRQPCAHTSVTSRDIEVRLRRRARNNNVMRRGHGCVEDSIYASAERKLMGTPEKIGMLGAHA